MEIEWKLNESWKYNGNNLKIVWKLCVSWKQYGKCMEKHEMELAIVLVS